ncbi:MAG: amidohydrolase family protein [Spirochaetales bacterium]|nr:amidohydrolase family protein [Spirochaetales bacterium]
MKTWLKNGLIYDGSGGAPFLGDVLVTDDRITAVGSVPESETIDVDETIELDGLSLSSGFIDAHSHNDWFAIKKEPLKYFETFVRQGITSFVTGNCGLSAIGFPEGSPHIDKLGGGLFFFDNTTGRYGSAREYLDAVNNNCPCNIAVLVGHCSVRAGVSGFENRPLSREEEEQMLALIEQNLEEGACGVSLGLMYEPGLYADTSELKKVASLCEKYDKPLTVHPRAQSAVSMSYKSLFGRPHLLRALDELVEVSRGKKMKLQYSHAIFVGRKSFKCKDEAVSILHGMRENGVDAMFDIYSETLGVSVITVILPAWYQSLSAKEKNKASNIAKLKVLINATSKLLGFGFADIQIAYIGKGYERFEGKTVHEIALEEGNSDLKTYLKLCEYSNYKGRVNMGPYSTNQIISELSKDDHCLYMTDAWVEEHGIQNPAIYDCFPKFLHLSLAGSGDSMPRTIRKMTGGVADRFRLKDRGYVKEGFYADLTVFNEKELKDGKPDQSKAFGIEYVYINGKKVLSDNGLDTAALVSSGSALKVE